MQKSTSPRVLHVGQYKTLRLSSFCAKSSVAAKRVPPCTSRKAVVLVELSSLLLTLPSTYLKEKKKTLLVSFEGASVRTCCVNCRSIKLMPKV